MDDSRDAREIPPFQERPHVIASRNILHIAFDGPKLDPMRIDEPLKVTMGHQPYNVTGLF